jgi:uncharacterized protein involved in outer membrane biogenesis
MNVSHRLRRGLIWVGVALLVLATLAVLTGVALDAGYLRAPLLKVLAAHLDRPIRVDGPLSLHIFSSNPRLVAERLTVGNPAWTPAGNAAEVGKLTVVFATPRLGQELIVDRLQIDDATLHLIRDVTGHANWQVKNPDQGAPHPLIVIRSLTVRMYDSTMRKNTGNSTARFPRAMPTVRKMRRRFASRGRDR